MSDHYILRGHDVEKVDLMTWARWFAINTTNRGVGNATIGDAHVSTVFIGLDHQWGDGPPLLFETMVFGGKFDMEQERYSTWADSEAGHAAWLAKVREALQ